MSVIASGSSGGSGGGGDVAGPASSVDNGVAGFDGTTGKALQARPVTIADVAAGGVVLAADDGVTAQLDLTFNTKGAASRYNFQINGVTKMDFTDVGGGAFALRNVSGQVRTSSGRFDDNYVSWNDDAAVGRIAAGVVGMGTNGNNASGWMQWAGESYLAADATNSTATLATTGLSVTVKAGRRYAFRATLYVSDSVATEGVQIDCAGGTAAATNFRAHVTGFDTALAVSTQVASLGAVASAGTFTGSGIIEIHGSFEPSSNGTFIPRFAQATHAAGTLTLYRGSHLLMWDLP